MIGLVRVEVNRVVQRVATYGTPVSLPLPARSRVSNLPFPVISLSYLRHTRFGSWGVLLYIASIFTILYQYGQKQ